MGYKMERILKNIGSVCIIIYSIGIIANFIPAGHTQKAVKLVLLVYIVNVTITSINNFNSDINQYSLNTDISTDLAEEMIITEAEKNIEEEIINIFAEKNIAYNSVNVHIHKQNNGLEIDSVQLFGVPHSQREYATELLNADYRLIFGD